MASSSTESDASRTQLEEDARQYALSQSRGLYTNGYAGYKTGFNSGFLS
jgi:hypothetical protein